MVQLTSGCCQIWLSLIREKNIFKLKYLENSIFWTESKDKKFSLLKKSNFGQKNFFGLQRVPPSMPAKSGK